MKIVDIQKHITHFSEQLSQGVIHEQDVSVGGKVTAIVPPFDESYPMYILFLDDKVGTTHVFVPETMIDSFPEQIQIGNYVFVEGFANVVTRKDGKKIEKEVSVFAYAMKDITKVGETN